jgi:hypothetical protein
VCFTHGNGIAELELQHLHVRLESGCIVRAENVVVGYQNRCRISARVALCEALCLLRFDGRRTHFPNAPRPDTFEQLTPLSIRSTSGVSFRASMLSTNGISEPDIVVGGNDIPARIIVATNAQCSQ